MTMNPSILILEAVCNTEQIIIKYNIKNYILSSKSPLEVRKDWNPGTKSMLVY